MTLPKPAPPAKWYKKPRVWTRLILAALGVAAVFVPAIRVALPLLTAAGAAIPAGDDTAVIDETPEIDDDSPAADDDSPADQNMIPHDRAVPSPITPGAIDNHQGLGPDLSPAPLFTPPAEAR
jgi:hypothetical protein